MKFVSQKQAPVIVLSGPSGTAKTTLINNIASYFNARSVRTVIVESPARKYFKKRIDSIRKDAMSYFAAQIEIATHLNSLYASLDLTAKNTVYLLDRCLLDTLMYTKLYVDRSKLTDFVNDIYKEFISSLMADIVYFQHNYRPTIFLTSPLNINTDDGIRPKELYAAQKNEFKTLKALMADCNIDYYLINKYDFESLGAKIYGRIIDNF